MAPSPIPHPAILADPSLLALSILIVDDEPANVSLLQYTLAAAGFTRVHATTDPRMVLRLCRECAPDLILLDLMMPLLSGFAVMEQLQAEIPAATLPPILVLTADVTSASRYRALTAGAADFLTKPLDEVEVLLRIGHLLKIQWQHQQLARQNDSLEDTVRARTADLRSTLGRLEETLAQLHATQQQVIQHERLSALGAMAAGLAHDFNNSLSLILGYSELLLEDLAIIAPEPRIDEFLRTIITAAEDAARMFGRLRGFYRPLNEEQARRKVDLNLLAGQAVALTRPRWHSQALGEAITITMETDLAADLPVVLADGPELLEMLTNLIFNAVDAMPRGGTISLRTRLEFASLPASEDALGLPADSSHVVIEVADTGSGMSEEVRRRCLEPFFTTKGQRGTGLGLAMVYGTVQRHGGLIDVQSAPGLGTRFILRLPLPAAEEASVPDLPPPAERKSWRILAVDDQAAFLAVVRRFLLQDQHLVETASNGEEALERFQACPCDLVITDQAMPGLSGQALALRIKALAPSTRVILLTGFHDLDGEASALPRGIDLIVNKPTTQATLRTAVQRVMAGVSVAVQPALPRRRHRRLPSKSRITPRWRRRTPAT